MVKLEVKRLWEFFRLLYPCQVVFITCYANGRSNVMTSSALPVSFKPPLLAVSIAPTRYSYHLIRMGREFVVNIPSASLMEKALLCGMTSGRGMDKFKELALTPAKARLVAAPIIQECIAHLECRLVKEVEAGDHVLFIGEVLTAYAEADLVSEDDDGILVWNLEKANLLLHVGGRVFTVPGKPVKALTAYSFFTRFN
ncbi:MAG: flavin reductase family protein [Candidatus Nezhaarchaeales archaeon]